jgi:hypothetical protein
MTLQEVPPEPERLTDQTPLLLMVPGPLYEPKPVLHESETLVEPLSLPVQLIPKSHEALKPHWPICCVIVQFPDAQPETVYCPERLALQESEQPNPTSTLHARAMIRIRASPPIASIRTPRAALIVSRERLAPKDAASEGLRVASFVD